MRLLVSTTNWAMSALAQDLAQLGFYVTMADTGDDLLEYAIAGGQDAIVMTLDLPGVCAFTLLREMSFRHTAPVTVMTDPDDLATMLRCFQRGADDCIAPNRPVAELAAQVIAQVRRRAGYAMPQITVGPLAIDLTSRTATVDDAPLHLTRLEYELLEMLALRQGSLITRDQIMTHLYGWDDAPDPKVIDVYICHIRQRIARLGGGTLIQTSFGRGYRMSMPPRLAIAA